LIFRDENIRLGGCIGKARSWLLAGKLPGDCRGCSKQKSHQEPGLAAYSAAPMAPVANHVSSGIFQVFICEIDDSSSGGEEKSIGTWNSARRLPNGYGR